jgi:hypothetical protein
MAFTYTDRNKKVVLHSWGRHRAKVMEAVVVGDLVARYNSDAVSAYEFADQSDGQAATAVALEDIAAAGEGWFALAVELKAPVSIATGGAVTQSYFAGSTDYPGAALYLGEDGKPSSSAGGTTPQYVGCLLTREKILLTPGGGLLAGAGAFSTITASSNLQVSGNTTLTGTLTCNGNVTLGSGETLTLTKGDATLTEGSLVLTAGVVKMVQKTSKTATATLTDAEQGYVEVSPAGSTTLTLPTAAAGKYFLIKHLATTQTLIVAAGASDKLIDPSDGGVHDKATDDKGLDCVLELRAVDAVNWLVIHHDGDWTFAD